MAIKETAYLINLKFMSKSISFDDSDTLFAGDLHGVNRRYLAFDDNVIESESIVRIQDRNCCIFLYCLLINNLF